MTLSEYSLEHIRFNGLDVTTFQSRAPTDEERNWFSVKLDGPIGNVNNIVKLLYETGIHDWYWMDRAPDRMVWRTTLYFKNENDMMAFLLRHK
jgi:hypothetical protein